MIVALLQNSYARLVVVIAALVLFYEGVPLGPLNNVPWLSERLQVVVGGRVDREAARARAGLVSEGELAAAQASARLNTTLLNATLERLSAVEETNNRFQLQLSEAAIEQENADDEIAELMARATDNSCRVDADLLSRLRNR